MTKEEAIWYLQPIADSASLPRYAEALNMAISALREQEHFLEATKMVEQSGSCKNRNSHTNADKFRAMTDEELADLFVKIASNQRKAILEALHEKGIIAEVCVVEMPALAKVAHLQWLREPAKEE